MASFNFPKSISFYLLIYFKFVYSAEQPGLSGSGTISSQQKPGVKNEDPNYLKYTFTADTKCTGVKYDGKDVWKRDSGDPNNPYSESVVFSFKGNTAFVKFKDSRNVFRFEDNQWNTIFSGKPVPKSINVLLKAENCGHKYEANNKVFTYTPKGEVLFNKVISNVGTAEEVLFETTDSLLFVHKVVYNETDSNKHSVELFHLNGFIRKFERGSDGKWTESEVKGSGNPLDEDKVEFVIKTKDAVSSGQTLPDGSGHVSSGEAKAPSETSPESKGPSSDPSCGSSTGSENQNPEAAEAKSAASESANLSIVASKGANHEEISYLKYTFEDGNRCIGVKYDGKSVWNRISSSTLNPYPESVVFSVGGSRAFVIFKESMSIFRFDGIDWESFFSGNGEQKTVNVLFKDGCENYDCVSEDKIYTYKTKDGKLFNKVESQVDHATEVIFQTSDFLLLAYKVVYDETDSDKLVVKIYGVDGFIRKFERVSDGKWTESEVKGSDNPLDEDKADFRMMLKPKSKLTYSGTQPSYSSVEIQT